MQSEATHPHHYFNTRTVRAFAGLFGLVLLLLFSSQTALAQDARVQALQDQLDRLHEVVQLGKEAYYANPTDEALADVLRDYQAYEDLALRYREALSQTEPAKIAQTGGPDGFGYTYKDSGEPDGPSFDFTSISGTAALSKTAAATMCTPGVGACSDDGADLTAIGFSFPFYGSDYTTTWVASNGYLNPAGNNLTDFTQDCPITSPTTPNTTMGVYWDDLSPNIAGGVWYGSYASCPTGSYSTGECFVAEWVGVP